MKIVKIVVGLLLLFIVGIIVKQIIISDDTVAKEEVIERNIDSVEAEKFPKPTDEQIQSKLTDEQYYITQKDGTEAAFSGLYWDKFDDGIYVDIVTGQPLFSSRDKYQSGCGWPSYTKPITENAVVTLNDTSYNMIRIEVRSSIGDSHLGHVFDDGPKEFGGKRYCIDSAALLFIPLEEMDNDVYRDYIKYVE